jgi:hypothetical protein
LLIKQEAVGISLNGFAMASGQLFFAGELARGVTCCELLAVAGSSAVNLTK